MALSIRFTTACSSSGRSALTFISGGAVYLDFDTLLVGFLAAKLGCGVHNSEDLSGDKLDLHLERVELDPGKAEDVLDYSVEPVRVFNNYSHKFFGVIRIVCGALQKGLNGAFDGCDRRPDLVRDVGHELAAHFLKLAHAAYIGEGDERADGVAVRVAQDGAYRADAKLAFFGVHCELGLARLFFPKDFLDKGLKRGVSGRLVNSAAGRVRGAVQELLGGLVDAYDALAGVHGPECRLSCWKKIASKASRRHRVFLDSEWNLAEISLARGGDACKSSAQGFDGYLLLRAIRGHSVKAVLDNLHLVENALLQNKNKHARRAEHYNDNKKA